MEIGARIVADTGPLIALSAVDRLGLLGLLFRPVVPEAVIRELLAGATDTASNEMMGVLQRSAELTGMVAVEPMVAVELDAGEAAVIQTARDLGIELVLIDERKARRLARRVYGLQTIGTARLLVEAKKHGHLLTVAPVLAAMIAAGYWIADEIVAWAKAAAGE